MCFSSTKRASISGLVLRSEYIPPYMMPWKSPTRSVQPTAPTARDLACSPQLCLPDHPFHCSLLAPGLTPIQPTRQASSRADADLANRVILLPLTFSTGWKKWLSLHPIETWLKLSLSIPASINLFLQVLFKQTSSNPSSLEAATLLLNSLAHSF